MTVTIEYSVKLESNPSVYIDGYVQRNDELGEDCDWYSNDNQGVAQYNRAIINHDGIDWFKGVTYEQDSEIDTLQNTYQENFGEIADIILQCDFEDIFYEPYQTKRYGLIIEVTSIETDCKYDSHDFLGGHCDDCGKCGFERWE